MLLGHPCCRAGGSGCLEHSVTQPDARDRAVFIRPDGHAVLGRGLPLEYHCSHRVGQGKLADFRTSPPVSAPGQVAQDGPTKPGCSQHAAGLKFKMVLTSSWPCLLTAPWHACCCPGKLTSSFPSSLISLWAIDSFSRRVHPRKMPCSSVIRLLLRTTVFRSGSSLRPAHVKQVPSALKAGPQHFTGSAQMQTCQ